ncbi:MAG: DUF559 domain-containing protein [Armatimonadetes bacterium]|nr:DUF559 domain-containing protein [Armatimonadota bacterium]
MPRKPSPSSTDRGEVLVAILNNLADFGILHDHLWYRVPVASAPKPWPPKWLAFYLTKAFGALAHTVHYFGPVREIRHVRRRDLFPNEIDSPKADREYYQVRLHHLESLQQPIPSPRWRRIVFIPTTWQKFTRAAEINDLFDDSPLEDLLWARLKELKIGAQRQWELPVKDRRYFLDFAIFCGEGNLDIETDGDTWHAGRERRSRDNRRDNALQSLGWHVLRFDTPQIKEQMAEYCVPQIAETINRLSGLAQEGLVPRVFYNLPEGTAQQLSLFEGGGEYELD